MKGKKEFQGDQVVGTAVARFDRQLPLTKSSVAGRKENSSPAGAETFQALVMQALQLRKIYREVFILRDIKGYSPEETAAILGIGIEAVARRLARARTQITLDEQGLPKM